MHHTYLLWLIWFIMNYPVKSIILIYIDRKIWLHSYGDKSFLLCLSIDHILYAMAYSICNIVVGCHMTEAVKENEIDNIPNGVYNKNVQYKNHEQKAIIN